jgi:DNA-binding protein HU-beta
VNKGGLVAEVAKRTGQSKADVARAIDSAITTIRETVSRGERVSLVGFGTFQRRRRGQRLARNPRRPEITVKVPERDVPSFLPGQAFREAVTAAKRRTGKKSTAKRSASKR